MVGVGGSLSGWGCKWVEGIEDFLKLLPSRHYSGNILVGKLVLEAGSSIFLMGINSIVKKRGEGSDWPGKKSKLLCEGNLYSYFR